MTEIRDKYEKADIWTYLHVSNIFPIVVGGLSLGISFFSLQTRQERLDTHVVLLEQTVVKQFERVKTLDERLNEIVSTMSARVVLPPSPHKLSVATQSGGVKK